MVAPGAFGKWSPGKPGPLAFKIVVAVLIVYSLAGGYFAGTQPTGKWRFFSWHPFLMTCGMVGFAGVGAVTKKLGGYTNTKLHGMLAMAGMMCSGAGLYVIYKNKEINGFQHMKTVHSWMGLLLFASCFGLGMTGSVVLHPDFGIDKTNKQIRFAHKMGARVTLIFVWFTVVLGFIELVPKDSVKIAMFSLPLALLIPFVLM